jgi:hypothetical protein
MKNQVFIIRGIVLAFLLVPSGCGRSGREGETAKLRSEMAKVQEQPKESGKELQAKQEQEAGRQAAEEAKPKQEAAEREPAEARQGQAVAAQEQKAKVEQERTTALAIEKCFNKIELRMSALLDAPRNFSNQTEAGRRQMETELKTVANGAKEEIGEIVTELKALGFDSVNELERMINSFIKDFNMAVLSQRLSSDYSTSDKGAAIKQAEQAQNSLTDAYLAFEALQQIRRHPLTPGSERADKSTQAGGDFGTHKFNSHGFCELCGWERNFLVRENRPKCSQNKE